MFYLLIVLKVKCLEVIQKAAAFHARGLSATGFSLLHRKRISRISNQNYQAIKIPMKSISLSDDGQQPEPTQKHLQTKHQ